MNQGPTLRRNWQRIDPILITIGAFILFFISFRITYHNIYQLNSSDLLTHTKDVDLIQQDNLLWRTLGGQNMMWHCAVRIVSHLLHLSRKMSACLVTAAFRAVYYLVACAMMRRSQPDQRAGLIPLFCLILCLAGPLHARWYNKRIYLGTGSPNIWHSPTQIAVQPFALLGMVFTTDVYSRLRTPEGGWSDQPFPDRGQAVLYALLMLFSEFAKPSFFQIIVPGLGLLMVIDLIRSRGRSFLFSVKLALLYVPAFLMTVSRFFSAFYTGAEGGGVSIAPFVYWKHFTRNIPFSMLLLLAFPLFVLLADRRHIKEGPEWPLALSLFAAACTEKALLIENGTRRWHGNFSWGYDIAVILLWFVAVKRFLHLLTQRDLDGRERILIAAAGLPLLAAHLYIGLVKINQLFTGNTQF